MSKIVYVLLRPDYADWEPALACAEIRQKGLHELVTVGLSNGPVMSLGGFVVLPDVTLDQIDLDQAALLLLPGGPEWRNSDPPEVVGLIEAVRYRQVPLAAICGATLALARQRVLSTVRHTSNSLSYLQEAVPGYEGSDLYLDELAVVSGGVITASGAGYVEFTREIVRLLGIYEGDELQMWFDLFKGGIMPQ